MAEGSEDAVVLHQEVAGLRAELARRDEEIVRLRDLLVARDAELGTARGRLLRYERRFGRVKRTVDELRSGAPVSGIAGKVMRRLLRDRH
ncbi:MAG TPA: hypothetical protein VF770_08730 [Solirubrobacterales bacterium]